MGGCAPGVYNGTTRANACSGGYQPPSSPGQGLASWLSLWESWLGAAETERADAGSTNERYH